MPRRAVWCTGVCPCTLAQLHTAGSRWGAALGGAVNYLHGVLQQRCPAAERRAALSPCGTRAFSSRCFSLISFFPPRSLEWGFFVVVPCGFFFLSPPTRFVIVFVN